MARSTYAHLRRGWEELALLVRWDAASSERLIDLWTCTIALLRMCRNAAPYAGLWRIACRATAADCILPLSDSRRGTTP
jgi:hypothetical protein